MKRGGLSEKMWLHDDPQTNWCSTDLLVTEAQANQLGLPAIEYVRPYHERTAAI